MDPSSLGLHPADPALWCTQLHKCEEGIFPAQVCLTSARRNCKGVVQCVRAGLIASKVCLATANASHLSFSSSDRAPIHSSSLLLSRSWKKSVEIVLVAPSLLWDLVR